jgi:hypothetical protein
MERSDLSRARVEGTGGKEETEGRRGDARGEEGRRRNHGVELKIIAKPRFLEVPESLSDRNFVHAWTEWVEYRLEAGAEHHWPVGALSFRKALTKCEKWGIARSIAAIDYSIEMGYRGLFEPRYPENLNNAAKEQKIVPRL